MGKIKFINDSARWAEVYARVVDAAGEVADSERVGAVGGIDFDASAQEKLFFENGMGNRTASVHPGDLSLEIDYRYNPSLERMATYVGAPLCTGHVESFSLRDEANLSHRDDTSKLIHTFVPSHYDGSEPYDLLYFFDAQNLFCGAGRYTENGDPYGSWQLDAILDILYRLYGKKVIVVGIDNADKYRDRELFMERERFGELTSLAYMEPREDYSHGYLDGLSKFMVRTLHPFIMKRYNVREDNIGIGGSSMGGIASFYCAMREYGFYKYVLSYSPAFALYGEEAYDRFFDGFDFAHTPEMMPKIHIYCGGGDVLERLLEPASRSMRDILVRHGYDPSRIFYTYDSEKPHNEESWRLILPESFSYLLR